MRKVWALSFLTLFVLLSICPVKVSWELYGISSEISFAYAETDLSQVSKVMDDYTLKLEDDRMVRLIGIGIPRDFPRTNKYDAIIHSFQRLSYLFIKNFVEGKRVRLEFDQQRTDKHGRNLAYAYLENGTFLNDKIVREGYAQALKSPINTRYRDLFLQSETQAKKDSRGLWAILNYITLDSNFMSRINMDFLKDGTYLGKDATPLGTVGLEVVVKNGRIKEIRILKNSFSHCQTINKAFVLMPSRIVINQSLDVDAVTGATVSSNSIKYAILDALRKAEAK
jgi:uncharacterized protein with FMN-binding domain